MRQIAIVDSGRTSEQYRDIILRVLQEQGCSFTPHVAEADLVLSVGGDGTFLNAASQVGERQTPILGINTGHLGFLADVDPADIADCLQRVLAGEGVIQPRSVLQVTTEGENLQGYPYALNEVAILKHDNSSLIQIETFVNGHLLNAYLADGLIVATPTGSTGYSLSVGGPILSPDSDSFCLSAVAPHSLNVRPVILRDNVDIELRISSRTGHYLLALDGRSQSLSDTTSLRLCRAPYNVNVVKVQRKEFFDTLRAKMHWGIDAR